MSCKYEKKFRETKSVRAQFETHAQKSYRRLSSPGFFTIRLDHRNKSPITANNDRLTIVGSRRAISRDASCICGFRGTRYQVTRTWGQSKRRGARTQMSLAVTTTKRRCRALLLAQLTAHGMKWRTRMGMRLGTAKAYI